MNMHENLKAYLDGQLSPEQARLVESALQSDAGLRKEFDELRRISSTLREASVAPAVAGLQKTIDAIGKAKAPRSPFMRFVPAAAAIGVCAIAMIVIGRFSRPERAVFNDNAPKPLSKKPGSTVPTLSNRQDALGNIMYGADFDNTIVTHPPSVNSRAPVGGLARKRAGESYAELNSTGTMPMTQPVDKQIVKTGNVDLRVANGKNAIDAASKLAINLGGMVESSNLTGDNEHGMTGSLTLRVPVARFDQAMAALQRLGKVTNVSRDGTDVTSTVVDNDTRLKTMLNQERAYQKILGGAKHVNDVLAVKDRLDEVQQNIASLTAEQKTLKKEAAMSTINVSINQPAPKKAAGVVKDDWLNNTWTGAWSMLSFAGRKITEALIYLIVFCPVWIPMVVLANLFTKRMRQTA